MSSVAERVRVEVHGACVGAGIELPAFAARVVAHPAAFFQLPEIGMGLIPGAGGTVSLPRRIGRQRTAWLALTGSRLDAPTALAWNLIDEVCDSAPTRTQA
jgi:enoyl-CoA hydratase/carnithine racemase